MQTGENEHGLRAIADFTRLISIAILLLHFYIVCHAAFEAWHLNREITDRIALNIHRLPVFKSAWTVKLSSLLLLAIYLIGARGKKNEQISIRTALAYLISGLLFYFFANCFLFVTGDLIFLAIVYMSMTAIGYLLMVVGGSYLSRILKVRLKQDIFNDENESFPQEERLIENEYSVNLPARYKLKGKYRSMWLNIINAARMCLICGSAGAGKSYFLINNIIKQLIERKQFSMVLYDFKYDDLAKIAYNSFLKTKHLYKVPPKFCVINFDRPIHRCNPLNPGMMTDITDATESARTILLGLNPEWQKRSGDFFVESAINFVTAAIWYLKKYNNGIYCTLPHVIELLQADYHDLFPILRSEPAIEAYVNPFFTALANKAMEQLEGQTGSAKIALARLSSPLLYYVLSGNDFPLDVNNPEDPKILVLANNPEKVQIYGAVISLYMNRLFKILPKKQRMKCTIVADEFASLYAGGIDAFLSIARSYKIFTFLAIQNLAQLVKNYGKEQADVLFSLAGNIICGQAIGDTAKAVQEAIGKIVQTSQSISINSSDTSVSKNTHLDYAVPASRITRQSSGEFSGVLADNPDQPLKQKLFHCEIINDHEAIAKEAAAYVDIPEGNISEEEIEVNFIQVKNEITELISDEIERIQNDPELAYLLIDNKKAKESN